MWLDSDGLHGYLLGRSVASERDRARAAQKYAALVTDADEGKASLWQTCLRQQVYLGDEDFVARMQALASTEQRGAGDVPKAQRKLLAVLRTRVKMVFRARHCPAWGSARLVGAASSA